jgi:hypothetical protein
MRRLILIFLVVIAVGGVTGASASDPPYGAGATHPPSLPSDVTCTSTADWNSCFYPAHDR